MPFWGDKKSRKTGVKSKRKSKKTSPDPSTNGAKRSSSSEIVSRSNKERASITEEQPTVTAFLETIPTLRNTPLNARGGIFTSKMVLCTLIPDLEACGGGVTVLSRVQDVKREQLLELVQYIGTHSDQKVFSRSTLKVAMAMIRANIFRPLPPVPARKTLPDGVDESVPAPDANWPRLSLVYEFLLRFIVSSDVEIPTLKEHITGAFVCRLLANLDSEDPREREAIKTIVHRVYAKFMSMRTIIRKHITHVMAQYRSDQARHCGIPELLEILGPIISGFAQPLKQEHRTFCVRILVPLYKVNSAIQYQQQLAYCLQQFIEKDADLVVPIVNGILSAWPMVNCNKTLFFLNNLEDFIEAASKEHFRIMLKPVFSCLARIMASDHFQVAERALFIWHNEVIHDYMVEMKQDIIPVMYCVVREAKSHWNPSVNQLRLHVLNLLNDLDSALADKCQVEWEEKRAARIKAHAHLVA